MLRILNICAVIFIALVLFPPMCTEQIEPGKIGIRRSIEGGVSKQDFRVGRHWSMPFWHSWYQLDGTIHYLEFLHSNQTALDVRTKENNIIFIDVTLPYRIKEGQAWKIVSEGFADSYPDKVKSTAVGILREQLAELSNLGVQSPEERHKVAKKTLPLLNEALDQYHIEATHVIIRGIRFRSQYEQKLQNKQFFVVQGRLDGVRQRELAAKQITDTLEKTIGKDIALKREEWNSKIELAKADFELQIARIDAEAVAYSRKRRAGADADYSRFVAEGKLAGVLAEALGQRLKSQALASKAGRTYSAILGARKLELGDITLNSSDPTFFIKFGSMAAWRTFLLGD